MDLQVVHPACAGLDVHKRTVVACALTPAGKQTRTFRTWTGDLRGLADWLASRGVTHVVLEATGVYWKPVYNVLEDRFSVVVANPERVRAIAGQKTDVKDAEWLATLLRHGLVASSFIPDRPQRELRELTRYRTAKIQERAREVNRLQKTLEGANIKLAAVLTDVLGVSGQRILDALLGGEDDPAALAALAGAGQAGGLGSRLGGAGQRDAALCHPGAVGQHPQLGRADCPLRRRGGAGPPFSGGVDPTADHPGPGAADR